MTEISSAKILQTITNHYAIQYNVHDLGLFLFHLGNFTYRSQFYKFCLEGK